MHHPQDSKLTPDEESFLQALLWEESHLIKGQASKAAAAHDLSLIRVLEPANRLSPNLRGEALNRLHEGPCPVTQWPWPGKNGREVLELLWGRLSAMERNESVTALKSGT